MFTSLYLSTTNPELSLSQFMTHSGDIVLSSVFHTAVYTVFVNVVWFLFTGTMLTAIINQRLLVFLMVVMVFGYLARFYHVKEIYQAYGDKARARAHVDQLYVGWIFIG